MSPSPARALSTGCVNAHTHIYSGLAPFDMPTPRETPVSFIEILERVWWRLDRALDAEALRAAARFYVAEALLHGTTALIDHHESPDFIEGSLDVIADACQELGMRALLCYGATERNGGRDEARRGLTECRRFIGANARPLVRGAVGLHASFTVSDQTVRQAAALCLELGTVLHVHVAEDVADVLDAMKRGARGPLERLLSLDALPAGSILAHGVHLTEPQVRLADQHRLWLIQNPRSNEGNGVGYPRALWASTRVALGTDGYPSDLHAELDALARLARYHPHEEPAGATGVVQRLEAGRRLIRERFGPESLSGDRVALEPGGPGAGCRARTVAVAGRVVVEDGRLVTADLAEIRAHAREQAARLWPRMEAIPWR
jgi:cytosine/adenosine deaminase-related metal-dependent hydrolase